MTYLSDVLFDEDPDWLLLGEMLDGGYVSRRFHPEFPELAILNYTEKTAYEGKWNEVTLKSRGLIYNTDTFEVLARPFKKFFNYGQTGCAGYRP
jgi:RNA ligase